MAASAGPCPIALYLEIAVRAGILHPGTYSNTTFKKTFISHLRSYSLYVISFIQSILLRVSIQ